MFATDKTLFMLSSFCIFIGVLFSLSLPVFTNILFGYDKSFF